MDKYKYTKGNYKTSDIIEFMEEINLKLSNGSFRNPWMKAPYGGQKNGACPRGGDARKKVSGKRLLIIRRW